MSPAWAAVLASIIMMLGALSVALIRSGRTEGRLEAILDRLVDGHADHEKRIREVERAGRKR